MFKLGGLLRGAGEVEHGGAVGPKSFVCLARSRWNKNLESPPKKLPHEGFVWEILLKFLDLRCFMHLMNGDIPTLDVNQ